jgi:hypothetical protein
MEPPIWLQIQSPGVLLTVDLVADYLYGETTILQSIHYLQGSSQWKPKQYISFCAGASKLNGYPDNRSSVSFRSFRVNQNKGMAAVKILALIRLR